MKITDFDIRAVEVSMTVPHKTAAGVIEVCPLILISVETDQGVRGNGIVFCYMSAFLKPIFETANHVLPLLRDQTLDPKFNTAFLAGRFKLVGTQGFMGMVLGGIDMALWDALARSKGSALHQLLGDAPKPVKPYGNVGYDGVKGSAEGAGLLAQQGFLGVKAKIGYPSMEEELEVIREMRKAVGPDVALMVDYNQSLTFEEAKTRLEMLKDEGLTWVEEPIYSHDFSDYVRLHKETNAPLQAGENWWAPADFQSAFDAGVVERIMPDAQKCLGVTGWTRIAEMAAKQNTEVSSHLWPEVCAQLLSVTPSAGWLEYVDWFNPVIKEPLKIKNGFVDLEGVVGTGIEIDFEAASRFEVR
ncbi:MAG: enolase C-terminal domain-like protein [Pseudomonadota bacterium]